MLACCSSAADLKYRRSVSPPARAEVSHSSESVFQDEHVDNLPLFPRFSFPGWQRKFSRFMLLSKAVIKSDNRNKRGKYNPNLIFIFIPLTG
jgi:hypothetical protein